VNNEKFKLLTRRVLAWVFVGLVTVTLCFIAVWGTIHGIIELVTLAGGGLLTELGTVIAFYFVKKMSEE